MGILQTMGRNLKKKVVENYNEGKQRRKDEKEVYDSAYKTARAAELRKKATNDARRSVRPSRPLFNADAFDRAFDPYGPRPKERKQAPPKWAPKNREEQAIYNKAIREATLKKIASERVMGAQRKTKKTKSRLSRRAPPIW